VAKVREEITGILPDTQVIEQGTQALARAEARIRVADEATEALEQERAGRQMLRAELEDFSAIVVPLILVAAAVWIGLLAMGNVRERRVEIAVLRALGVRSRQVLFLFLSKAVLLGLAGGALGFALGTAAGPMAETAIEETAPVGLPAADLFDPRLLLLSLLLAPVFAVAASWLPAIAAAQQDPADILREE
jgi:putative ABC transport system permease protein